MLTKKQIETNKERYIDLIKSITTQGADIDGFLKWAEKSDFFVAPASSKYHCDYAGGLCQHSLNVYDALIKLLNEFQAMAGKDYSEDSVKIVALLHDISKTNFYEIYYRNVKDEATGEWHKEPEYKVRDPENRFIFGSHEQNSEYIIRTFFPISLEESTAILHHHGGMSWDSAKDDISGVFDRFPLATLLHLADMVATYVYERNH